jgi:autotransporter-associated beta strand protein
MFRSRTNSSRSRSSQRPRFRPAVELLEDRLVPSTLHWTGAASTSWSVANNWLENRAPVSGDIVAFDTTAAAVQNFTSNNDLSNLGLAGLVVNDADATPGHDFSITGNGVYLAGAVTSTTTGGPASLALSSITLLNPVTWTNTAGALDVASNLNINGMQLTVDGAGNTTLSGVVSGLNSPAGLRGDYYQVPASTSLLDPTSPSWLGFRAPTVTAVTPNVYFANVFPNSFAPYASIGASNVAARWTGWINVPTTGKVDFYTGSDDGSRLFVDGSLVVENNGFHGWSFLGGSANLTAGLHFIDIEYFQWVASGEIAVGWDPTGSGNPNNSVVIPASAFSTSDSLIKAGTGTLTLTGAETFDGSTTVNGGTLLVNGSLAAASTVTVNNGGTLSGSGSVGSVTVNVGGTIEPGAGGAVLSTGGVTFGAGTTFRVALDGAAPGTGYDQLSVTGGINLNGATLTGILGFTPAPGETFVIINNNGANPITGTFAGLPEGAAATLAGHRFFVSYHGGKGNDVTLTADRAPVAGAASLSYSLNENQSLSVAAPGLLAGASDPDGDPVSVALGTGPAHGTLTLGPGGAFTYTPAANFFGTDSFTYTVSDGELTTAPVTVTLNVSGTGVTTIKGKGVAVHGYEHTALSNVATATFVLGGGTVPPGSITAVIDWGDGTKKSAGVVSLDGTVYTVRGSHTYREEGNYKVSVSISLTSGSAAASILTTASVRDEPHHHRHHHHYHSGAVVRAIEALLKELHLPSTGHTRAIDLAFLEFLHHGW